MTPKIERFLADPRPPSPCLVVDLGVVGRNYRAIAAADAVFTIPRAEYRFHASHIRIPYARGMHVVAAPGAFNGLVAHAVAEARFEAVYISGAGLINGTSGYPDIGLLGMEEVVRQAGYITRAIDVAVIQD